MLRLVFAFLLLLGFVAGSTSASADNRRHSAVSVGLSFHAYVDDRPQVIVDRPKLVSHAQKRKLKVVKPEKGCLVKQASAIARDHGIRYQTIVRTARTVTIHGYRHGKKAKMVISRARDCAIRD